MNVRVSHANDGNQCCRCGEHVLTANSKHIHPIIITVVINPLSIICTYKSDKNPDTGEPMSSPSMYTNCACVAYSERPQTKLNYDKTEIETGIGT